MSCLFAASLSVFNIHRNNAGRLYVLIVFHTHARIGGRGRKASEANRVLDMSLACLVCHRVESPSHSFRSYSISSAENEGRCSAIANCLARRASLPDPSTTANSSIIRSSKVTPQPSIASSSGIPGTPRLVRSCAVRRDLVRDWNFEEVVREH